MSDLPPCDPEVFESGAVLEHAAMSAEQAEARCAELRAEYPGYRIDWHYVYERAVFKALAPQHMDDPRKRRSPLPASLGSKG